MQFVQCVSKLGYLIPFSNKQCVHDSLSVQVERDNNALSVLLPIKFTEREK